VIGAATRAARLLFGRPLASTEADHEAIGPAIGIAILGLDALASAAYGPEAALTVLRPAGVAGLRALVPVGAAVVGLLVLLCLSYRQVIAAYPDSGGAYTVARENIGRRASLVAAGALAIDYTLNVSVAIAAGVGALASALPVLLPHLLAIELALLALLTAINLRGVRTTGAAVAFPTYLFVLTVVGTIVWGFWRALGAGGVPHAASAVPGLPRATQGLGWWLGLRAFAAGCSAMTGVEAVSNAVPMFRAPRVRSAGRTLILIVALLAILLLGELGLCRLFGIGATEPGSAQFESVLSQLTRAVAGRGWYYAVTMASVFAVLCLSANTSFAAFPRLLRQLALDQFMPAPFARRGARLVYTPGILLLAGAAGLLLVAFGGVTDRLIPLFAIGALLAFTLSQVGMVAHARRHPGNGLLVNVVGAVATGAALVVVLASKLREGAWITLLLIPALPAAFLAIHRHLRLLDERLSESGPLEFGEPRPPVVIVPLRRLDRPARRALTFAASISPEVVAIQVLTENPNEPGDLSLEWQAVVAAPACASGRPPPELIVIRAKYRELLQPLVEHVHRIAALHPGRAVAVVIPDLRLKHWYGELLHAHSAALLKSWLQAQSSRRLVIVDVPWTL
jgi:amino acid transporter